MRPADLARLKEDFDELAAMSPFEKACYSGLQPILRHVSQRMAYSRTDSGLEG